MELFQIDPGLAIWTWIIFGLLFLVLSKFAIPSLLAGLKAREDTISKSIDDAKKIEEKLSTINEERLSILSDAKSEGEDARRLAREDAEKTKQLLLENARSEVLGVEKSAQLKIARDREVMIESLRHDLADLICDTAEGVAKRSFVQSLDREWTKEQVSKL